ncbi:MAG: hypothetical protein PHX83_13120 [Acidobacteriia bacterium]|nr:hypothetical protein [Terriglobia bacterium]
MKRNRMVLCTGLFLLLLLVSVSVPAQHPRKTERKRARRTTQQALMWRDPGDVAALNTFYGAGGEAHAPNPHGHFTFIKEDMNGTSPKFYVEDEQGVRWIAKMGQEPEAETAATRLLWAAGYFVDEDYYLDYLEVRGISKLKRGQEFISDDGIAHHVRLKRKPKEVKTVGEWSWFHNPFVGTREFNGLRIMMALINNWDLANNNTAIYSVDGEQHYLVKDVGASFGNTGNSLTRSKGVLKDYANSKFIDSVNGNTVNFVMHSRPFVLSVVNTPNYVRRTRWEDIAKNIPRADARWLGARLAQLSDDQIRDCFRAAGYSPDEVEGYTMVVKQRIAQLNEL